MPKVPTGAEEWLREKKVLEGRKQREEGGSSPPCNPRALDTQEPKKVGSRVGEWLTPRAKTRKKNLTFDQMELLPPDENRSTCGVRTAPPTHTHCTLKTEVPILPPTRIHPLTHIVKIVKTTIRCLSLKYKYFWSNSNDSVKGSCDSVYHLCLSHLALTSPCWRTKRGWDNSDLYRTTFPIVHYHTHTHTEPHFSPHLIRHAHEIFPALILHQAV